MLGYYCTRFEAFATAAGLLKPSDQIKAISKAYFTKFKPDSKASQTLKQLLQSASTSDIEKKTLKQSPYAAFQSEDYINVIDQCGRDILPYLFTQPPWKFNCLEEG